jgi:hypothetical protein
MVGAFAGGGVVKDHVHVEVGGDVALEGGQELLELDGPVASVR